MSYPIVNITGGDGLGKSTQVRLLLQAIQPSTYLKFPDYDHWSGQIIRGILNEETMHVERYPQNGAHGVVTRVTLDKSKDPESFQMLMQITRFAARQRLETAREIGFVICDRYDTDAEAYGTADGCDLDWIRAIKRTMPASDLSIVFVGKAFSCEGRVNDINDRCQSLQNSVTDRFRALAKLEPARYCIFNVDALKHTDQIHSVALVHRALVKVVANKFDSTLRPLAEDQIEEFIGNYSPQQRLPLAMT